MIVFHIDVTIRIDHRSNKDLSFVHQVRHGRVAAIVAEQVDRELERDLDRHDLARVIVPITVCSVNVG